tara:strand:- start:288 stop:617 length:330 start_codon:yes stop_codon:yes gene_type:complete
MTTSALVKESYARRRAEDPNAKFGDPNILTNAQPIGVKVVKQNAKQFNTKIQGICSDLKRAGYITLKELSAKLNDIGLTTRRGAQFNVHNLHRVLKYPTAITITKESEE